MNKISEQHQISLRYFLVPAGEDVFVGNTN